MKVNLTSPSNYIHEDDLADNVDENDPKQLRKIIEHLIKKSKLIIATLQNTVAQLEKVEGERDYWKNNYLRFKEVCQRYIDQDGIQHFKQLANLEAELKKLQIQKTCLIEEAKIKESHKLSLEKEVKDICLSKHSVEDSGSKFESSKKKMYKSITTLSYSRLSPHRQHQLHPKTIKIFKHLPIPESRQE